MTNAAIDQNNRTALIGVLNTDGTTIMRLYVNPANGALKVSDASTGTYPGGNIAKLDENGTASATGVSSADGTTILKVLINSSNQLLIKST